MKQRGFLLLLVVTLLVTLKITNAPVAYSQEPEPLETGGALCHAADLLGGKPFLLVNGDVWTDFSFSQLMEEPMPTVGAHLVLVDNPQHNPAGDFCILADGHLQWAGEQEGASFTFSGISLFHPQLVADFPQRRTQFALRELFDWAIKANRLTGAYHAGVWSDVGTPERLQQLRENWQHNNRSSASKSN